MIICADSAINKIVEEDITIKDSSTLKVDGIVKGNISVESNSKLKINGTVNGNIAINKNATVLISGIVNGTVNNYGNLTIAGIVSKLNSASDSLQIKEKAIVNGKQY